MHKAIWFDGELNQELAWHQMCFWKDCWEFKVGIFFIVVGLALYGAFSPTNMDCLILYITSPYSQSHQWSSKNNLVYIVSQYIVTLDLQRGNDITCLSKATTPTDLNWIFTDLCCYSSYSIALAPEQNGWHHAYNNCRYHSMNRIIWNSVQLKISKVLHR